MIDTTTKTAALDKLSIAFSLVCLLHCLALPLIVTLAPLVGTTLLSHEAFHQLMLIVVLPTSIGAFTLGCRQHRQTSVAITGGIGLALLIFAALAAHATWGVTAEKWITIAGGLVLAIAHMQNFKFCRHARCEGHHA